MSKSYMVIIVKPLCIRASMGNGIGHSFNNGLIDVIIAVMTGYATHRAILSFDYENIL
jgi:hypothetical protein